MKLGFRTLVLFLSATIYLAGPAAAEAQDDKKEEKKEEKKPEEKIENVLLKEGKAVVEGTVKIDDEKDDAQKFQRKVFTVTLKSAHGYKIDMTSKDLDSFLRLEDAAGKELARDDDSGGGVHARINFRCRADGNYRVICTTFNGGAGAFTLKILESSVPNAPQIVLKDGMAKLEGKLTATDAIDAVQTHSFCKIYPIKLAEGKSYQVDMVSKEIDSFLRLEDKAGKELAKDDDGGGARNARIQFECTESGDYYLIATTAFGGVGNYTLIVEEK